ncbi:MAG: hypothetical protein JNJ73_10645 [Hyphomonadaceae bacterium]|nr:hypothetical protein [Hyphomonadaceae bacterium]
MGKKRNQPPPAEASPGPIIAPPPRYWDWLAFTFDKPESQDGWFFDPRYRDEEFAADSVELVALFTAVMQRSGEDLKLFTDTQVKHGLSYHLNNMCGNVVFALQDKSVPEHLRDEAILALMMLYADCFAVRCAPVMCGTPANNGHYWEYPLNGFCYMLWDVSPLLSASPRLILPVLKSALYNKNVACQESALHGLGHLAYRVPEAGVIVDEYIRAQSPSGHLRKYAEAAAAGMVQ